MKIEQYRVDEKNLVSSMLIGFTTDGQENHVGDQRVLRGHSQLVDRSDYKGADEI